MGDPQRHVARQVGNPQTMKLLMLEIPKGVKLDIILSVSIVINVII